MKNLAFVLLVSLTTLCLAPLKVSADGMFVAPKFVWDKHRDINEPTQKAILVYDEGREDLILQVKYDGPVDEFGWLIPVPNLPVVQKGSMKCFYELSQYTQQSFENPWQHNQDRSMDLALSGNVPAGNPEPPVKVVEIKTVGDYEIVVLSTGDSGALEKWLDANRFSFPANAADAIDSYVKRQWYFVAVKINLGNGAGRLSATRKLANGELNPLQISFASDRCVFPLKISSANGTPSEIQVYVLSPEPLLEEAMLEKKLPGIYSNDMARAARSAEQVKKMQLMQRNLVMGFVAGTAPPDLRLSRERENGIREISKMPVADPGDLPPYARVTRADLPVSSQWIRRLADKSWWLTKQTWTFKPEEMRDLEFKPAIPVFAELLGTKYGYYAAAGLKPFGTDAVPVLIGAFQSTNTVMRVNAASLFDWNYGTIRDSRLTEAALGWLNDPEPRVRSAAIQALADYSTWNPKYAEPLVSMLRDENARVRRDAETGLIRHGADAEKFIPVFQQMLTDTNADVLTSGVAMLVALKVPIPHEALSSIFKTADVGAIGAVVMQYQIRGEMKISNEDAFPLLQNSEPGARMMGLRILYQNAEKQSVEMALPLLRDPDELVRLKAAQILRALTGRHFTEAQADEWIKWWKENKTDFVVELHPEELRPGRRGTNDFRRIMTGNPPTSPP